MNKKIMIEKVKVVNHERFWYLLYYSILSSFFLVIMTSFLLIVSNTNKSNIISYFSIPIYILIIFSYIIYKELAEEKIVKIEKEVWFK
ncbi:MAG TPA: hypothetical protein ENI61_00730 [Ignavibacteria bacterium]|nr:hypothetical protein [Ignavibacteria bacterium]